MKRALKKERITTSKLPIMWSHAARMARIRGLARKSIKPTMPARTPKMRPTVSSQAEKLVHIISAVCQ